MTKLNLQGLKINTESLEKAVSEIPYKTNGPLPELYLQISYDKSDGEVLTNMHADCNSQTEYRDSDIITVGYYTRRTSAQTIIDDIVNTIELDNEGKRLRDEQAKTLAHNEALWAKENGYPYNEDNIIKD